MSGEEHIRAEIASMRRRGLAAAPQGHPLRAPDCPSLGALAGGRLSETQREHVAECAHCRSLPRAAAESRIPAIPAFCAVAAVLVLAVLPHGWKQTAPARYAVTAVEQVQPAPSPVKTDWPAPLQLQAQGVPLPTPATVPPLPTIRPLERFSPPARVSAPVPVAALGGPSPPALEPVPPPDVVDMLGLRIL